MTTKTRLNVNLDADLKQEVGATLSNLGLDFTTAITIYFKQIAIKHRIPFDISIPQYYSVEEALGENWREGLEDLEDEWE